MAREDRFRDGKRSKNKKLVITSNKHTILSSGRSKRKKKKSKISIASSWKSFLFDYNSWNRRQTTATLEDVEAEKKVIETDAFVLEEVNLNIKRKALVRSHKDIPETLLDFLNRTSLL